MGFKNLLLSEVGTGALDLGKIEDTGHTSGDVGVMALAVRHDAATSLADTDLDYIPLTTDATGCLRVVTAVGGGGGASAVDDSAFTVGTDAGTPAMGLADEVAPDSVDEGDVGVFRMSLNRNLYINIRDAAGNERGANVDASSNLNVILASNTGVDIGDVDILSVIPGTGATNLGKVEDAPHTTGDVGVLALAVRHDAATALASTDLDYIPFTTDATGCLRVVTEPGAGGGTASTDDSVFTPGTTAGTPAFGFADETLPDSVDEGDTGALRMTLDRKLLTRVVGATDANRLDVDASGHAQVDIAASSATVTVDTELPAAATQGSDDIAAPTAPSVYAFMHVLDPGSGGWDRARGNSAAGLHVQIRDAAGNVRGANVDASNNLQVILASNSGVDVGDTTINNAAGASAVNIQDGGNVITVDGTVSADLNAGTNLVGDVGLSGARTSGGTTIFKSIDLDESEEQVKATAGQIYWIHAMNQASAKRYLKIYNATAATVVVGTTVPDLTFPLATQGDTNGAGFTLSIPNGIAFGTAITVAATTGIADADAGAPAANDVVVMLGFA